MKYLKYLKKFNVDEKGLDWITSPIIKYKCQSLGLKNYIINDNNSVDVDGDVDITYKYLKEIPMQFGVVYGSFECNHNRLTSLVGSPKVVENAFDCQYNQLTNLIGGPKEVGNYYNCRNNKLISLEGSPDKLSGELFCISNPIFEIYNLFRTYRRYKDSLDYNYLRGTNIIKLRLQEALEEFGENAPESIPGYKYI